MTTMKITALAGWFGGNRVLAESVGRELSPEGPWRWVRRESVNQNGGAVAEALLVRGGSACG